MKNQRDEDTGLMTVLIARFEQQRLPRALALQEKVAQGESLNHFDITFLKEVSDSVNEIKPLLKRRPECRKLATQMINLCREIAQKGLDNEKPA